MQHRPLGGLRKFVSTVTALATIVSPFATFVPVAHAANLVSESFGTGSSANDISGWNEQGDDDESSTRAQDAGGLGTEEGFSPADGNANGRFARIGEGEWICRTINASGYNSLQLSYYWRGDTDAGSSDDGFVEYRLGSGGSGNDGCNDDDLDEWTELQEHDLTVDSAWSTQSAFNLPDTLDNATFRLRFRSDANDSDEHFRVDGVLLTGDVIATPTPTPPTPTPPTPTPTPATPTPTPATPTPTPATPTPTPPACPPGTVGAFPVCIPIFEPCPPGTSGPFQPLCIPDPTPTPATPTPTPATPTPTPATPTPTPATPTPTPTGTLIVHKAFAGDDVGATAEEFSYAVDGSGSYAMEASVVLTPGTHAVAEQNNEEYLYTPTYGSGCDTDGNVSIVAGETTHCTVTNTFSAIQTPAPTATIHVRKQTVGGNGAFDFTVEGYETSQQDTLDTTNEEDNAADSFFDVFVDAEGTTAYTVSEEIPAGWQLTNISCEYDNEEAGLVIQDSVVVDLGPDDYVLCTFTNTFIGGSPSPTPEPESGGGGGGNGTPSRATLIVEKVIVFGEDASVSFSDFSFMVEGQDRDYERTFQFEEDGSNELSIYSGEYTITEEPGPGYTTGYEGDCAPDGQVEMLAGETYECIIVNTLGVGGFNPGSDIPAPTPSPSPTPSGSPVGGGSIQEDDFESATEVDVTGDRDVPASGSDSDEEALEAAIGNQGDWPWWIPWLILFLLILWWFWRRRSGS